MSGHKKQKQGRSIDCGEAQHSPPTASASNGGQWGGFREHRLSLNQELPHLPFLFQATQKEKGDTSDCVLPESALTLGKKIQNFCSAADICPHGIGRTHSM